MGFRYWFLVFGSIFVCLKPPSSPHCLGNLQNRWTSIQAKMPYMEAFPGGKTTILRSKMLYMEAFWVAKTSIYGFDDVYRNPSIAEEFLLVLPSLWFRSNG